MATNSLQKKNPHGSLDMDQLKEIMRTTVPETCLTSLKKKDGTKKSVMLYANRTLDFAAPLNAYDEVYPGILLGGQYLAKEKQEMKFLGITHVVNCAQGEKFAQINTNEAYYAELGLHFHGIRATDVSTYKMLPHLHEAANFIAEALDNNGRVFVHCHMGMSRSATVVLAYLMIKKGLDAGTAMQKIRSKRAVWPNDGFLKQICILNEELLKKNCGEEEKYETECDMKTEIE